jgi:hypothetical protein
LRAAAFAPRVPTSRPVGILPTLSCCEQVLEPAWPPTARAAGRLDQLIQGFSAAGDGGAGSIQHSLQDLKKLQPGIETGPGRGEWVSS